MFSLVEIGAGRGGIAAAAEREMPAATVICTASHAGWDVMSDTCFQEALGWAAAADYLHIDIHHESYARARRQDPGS